MSLKRKKILWSVSARRERECVFVPERKRVCVCAREREKDWVCQRESVCVCANEAERESEKQSTCRIKLRYGQSVKTTRAD